MATKTFDELKQLAIQIRDEKTNKQNTANRVGTAMLEGINKLEQDYYDKTAADKELKKRDDKLIELANNVGLYNVDKHVPLGGGFYTSATARAAVPSDIRKIGLIITYKTDVTTSVTEQFIGSDVSGWTTDANWKNVGSEGGNKILEWKTDAATTRKKVPVKERKAGMQISYKPTDSDWVNEQYVGTSFTDTEWVKDSNWEKIPKQKQLTELDKRLENINDDINESGIKENGIELDKLLTEYTSIGSNGVLGSSVWKVYSFVIEKNNWYHVLSKMSQAPNNQFARAVLSKGVNPVKVLALGDGTTNLYDQIFEVDVDADTLYVLSYLSESPSCKKVELSLKDKVTNLEDKINDIGNISDLKTNNRENLVSAINEVSEISTSLVLKSLFTEIIQKGYSDLTWTDGWWNGTEIAPSGSHTNPIPVKEGDILQFRTKSINSSKESVLVLVDEKNTSPAKKALVKATSSDFTDYEYQMVENGYVSIGGYFTSSQQSQFQLTIIRFNNLEKLYQKVAQNRTDIDYIKSSDDLKLPPLSDNPLERIRYEAGMTSIFNSWGFVADSLGSGETAVNVFGQIKRKDLYEYSWGQKLCKICGVEGYNFSYGGQTAKGWIEDTNSERAWGHAKKNPKQAYIIALGVNDLTHIAKEEYTVGNVNTDIGAYDAERDTDTNAETFVGYYVGIIQRLKSVSPRCRIFCSTIPNGSGQLDSLNEAIRQIVKKFDNVYLIDIKKYNTDKKIYNMSSGTYLNDHYSALGYLLIAYMYCTYIDWVIRKNPMDFIEVARIMYSDEEIRDSWTL